MWHWDRSSRIVIVGVWRIRQLSIHLFISSLHYRNAIPVQIRGMRSNLHDIGRLRYDFLGRKIHCRRTVEYLTSGHGAIQKAPEIHATVVM